jgi:hypothetical protein
MPYVIFKEKMLDRIAHLFMDGKTVPQIRGVMTLEYGRPNRVFTEKNIQKELDDMGFSEEDILKSEH